MITKTKQQTNNKTKQTKTKQKKKKTKQNKKTKKTTKQNQKLIIIYTVSQQKRFKNNRNQKGIA